MDGPQQGTTHLTWTNVGLALTFVLFDAALSVAFGLGVGSSLVTAAARCIGQLSIMALLLNQVFGTNNPWAVAGLSGLLVFLGTSEVVINKSKRRHSHMFPATLASLACSTVPISILGTRFAMSVDPFWRPAQYSESPTFFPTRPSEFNETRVAVPILGMLSGSAISGVVVAVSFVLRELQENRDKVEMYLAFGATRMEACRGVATEALRLALLPVINQMSVIGLIAIPGMMTGAILGGSSVQQAARLQMVIMFMISASTALAAMSSIVLALGVVVDGEHRIRDDRVQNEKHAVWRARDAAAAWLMRPFGRRESAAGRRRE